MGNPNCTVSMLECFLVGGQNNFLCRRKRFEFSHSLGQKCPKRLRLPAGKNTHEHMGWIVPEGDLPQH
jgi:hypothetical protein